MLRVCRIAVKSYLVVNWKDNDLMIARLTL